MNWTQAELATRSRLELEAIELFEAGEGDLATSERLAIGTAFNFAGVIAIAPAFGGPGVRFTFPVRPLLRAPLTGRLEFDF